MLSGYGWCILRSTREPYHNTDSSEIDAIDNMVNAADRELWVSFHGWLESNPSPWVKCHFHEQLNNQTGILMFCVSRNHRSSPVWDMLKWIASNGPGSYGLFFVNDDEDSHDATDGPQRYSRFTPPVTYDFTNVFRVHRIANGEVVELEDPFFGTITPNLEPPHAYDTED